MLMQLGLTKNILFTSINMMTAMSFIVVRIVWGWYWYPQIWRHLLTVGIDESMNMGIIRWVQFWMVGLTSHVVNHLWTLKLVQSAFLRRGIKASRSGGGSKRSKDDIVAKCLELMEKHTTIPVGDMNIDIPLSSLGVDSKTALLLTKEMSTYLDLELDPTILFRYPTIRRLADGLSSDSSTKKGASEKGYSRNTSDTYSKIEVVGMACRSAGANNITDLWDSLLRGVDSVVDAPSNGRGKFPGGYMSDVFGFDNTFFGISGAEANHMNLSQRLCMEVAWEALEDAGIDPLSIKGKNVGVFVGISDSEPPPTLVYAKILLLSYL